MTVPSIEVQKGWLLDCLHSMLKYFAVRPGECQHSGNYAVSSLIATGTNKYLYCIIINSNNNYATTIVYL